VSGNADWSVGGGLTSAVIAVPGLCVAFLAAMERVEGGVGRGQRLGKRGRRRRPGRARRRGRADRVVERLDVVPSSHNAPATACPEASDTSRRVRAAMSTAIRRGALMRPPPATLRAHPVDAARLPRVGRERQAH